MTPDVIIVNARIIRWRKNKETVRRETGRNQVERKVAIKIVREYSKSSGTNSVYSVLVNCWRLSAR